jgi:tetratricopeptide (TPR) repeat protein
MGKKRVARGESRPAAATRTEPESTIAKPASEIIQALDIKPEDVRAWLFFVFATLIAYWPALQGGLLWDDASHITRPELQSLHGLWRIWFELGSTQQYYPLLHSAFWIEHRLWGDAVLGYHLTNIVLHATSAWLVMLIVKRLALPGAWLAGLVFAVHPVMVEAVAWISEQKSTLSGFFYLAAALAFLWFKDTRRRTAYVLATALFVLALFSKTVTAVLPAVLLVVLWWRRWREQESPDVSIWATLKESRRDVLDLLPWFALGVPAGLLTAWVERKSIGAEGSDFTLTFIDRFLLAGRVIWFYAWKLLWPVDLIFTYPRWEIDSSAWFQYLFLAALLAVAIFTWTLARKGVRGPVSSLLIFAGTLFPVLGFLNVYPFRFSYVADHFQYLASLALIVPAAVAYTLAVERIGAGKGKMILSAALVIVLAVLTWRQSVIYRDAETLYRETIARNPASWMARNNLGFILAQKPGELNEAITEYESALETKPDYAAAHLNLGNALQQIPGRLPDAVAHYEAALRITPTYPEAHNGLGSALSELPGRLPDAIAEYQAALREKPDFAEAHNNLGYALSRTPGRLPEAIQHYQDALRIRPDDVAAHYNLGTAWSKMPGHEPEAIAEFETVLRIRPGLDRARQMIAQLRAPKPVNPVDRP